MSLANKILCRITGRSDDAESSSTSRSGSKAVGKPEEELKRFIGKAPKATYTFDSERDAPESKLCREDGPRGRECVMIHMQSRKLFEAMQDNGFFCVLPIDPTQTHIECTPKPDS